MKNEKYWMIGQLCVHFLCKNIFKCRTRVINDPLGQPTVSDDSDFTCDFEKLGRMDGQTELCTDNLCENSNQQGRWFNDPFC